MQLRADAKFNFIVTRILGQYINFRARKTAAIKWSHEQDKEICQEIWQQMDSFVGSNFVHVIMVLLRTNAEDYKLDCVLYYLFEKTHELILRQQRQTFPEVLIIILAVLFYKHWLQMFRKKQDKISHKEIGKTSLERNFDLFEQGLEEKWVRFIRCDDRILQTYLYKGKIWYDIF